MIGNLILTTGPAGVGKTMVLKAVFAQDNAPQTTVSFTTRQARIDEENGREYWFVKEKEFRLRVKRGEFAEWADNHGRLYGTTIKELETRLAVGDVVMDIDYKGARQIRGKIPEAKSIFLVPNRMSDLFDHMSIRGSENADSLARRMKTAEEEIKQAISNPWFDYYLINRNKDAFTVDFRDLVEELRGGLPVSLVFSNMRKLQKHLASL
jgi:guanylate kinase